MITLAVYKVTPICSFNKCLTLAQLLQTSSLGLYLVLHYGYALALEDVNFQAFDNVFPSNAL